MKGLGNRIKKSREEIGLNQEAFAEVINISTSYLQAIERGDKAPKLSTFVRLANALHVSTDFLLAEELDNTIDIECNWLSEIMNNISDTEKEKIIHVIDTMIKDIM